MAYRSSTGDLGFFDEPPRRPERWDREKFERIRGRGGPSERASDEHDHFRFEEHDRFGPGGRSRRDIEIDDRFDRRGPRLMERERFREEERFGPPRRQRTEFLDEPTPSEIANRALAPYRRKSIVERDFDPPARRPARPQYMRRQSSLDTFDRKPLPRYGDLDREEWRPPINVPIPLPIREKSRRRSPSRQFEEFEEIRYRDVGPRESEEYREVEVRREKSTNRSSRSHKSKSVKSSRSSSSSSFEEVSPVREVGKKGKTRMPKRLAKKQAVIELGYPYVEEDDFLVVQRALEKEQIDEIIKISENYKEVERTTYVYEDNNVEPPPPPPPLPPPDFFNNPPPPPQSVHSSHPPPPPQSVHSHHPPPPPSSVHSSHHPRTVFEERIEESNHVNGPLTILVPEDRRVTRSERDIKEEIRALESERRLLKYEREGDYEIIERREPKREIVRLEKDRKAKGKPNPKLVAAMMSTLT